MKQHPQAQVVFAHGFFMLESDLGMAKLGKIFDENPNVFVDFAYVHNLRQPARYTVSKARDFYIKYRDRILFGSDVFAAGSGASAFLNERKLLETNQMTAALHGGAVLQGLNLPDSVLNHIYYWNAARLIPRVRTVLKARGFRIGYELGKFKFDRLPPDVTVSNLTIKASLADLTGTLNSVTDSLAVEINGKVYPGIDNKDGTWKLAGANFSGLPVGTYDVKVTAKNSLGLLRTDTTKNELTIESAIGVALSHKNTDQEIRMSHLTGNKYRVHFPFSCAYTLSVYDNRGLEEASYKGVGPSFTYLDFSNKSPGLKLLKINYAGKIAIRKIIQLEP